VIHHLTGTVTAAGATWVVLDLNGFGLKALCTPDTAAGVRLGEPVTLHTSLVVREDSLTLYAFADAESRDCFELALSASGVGPKIAQAMMSVLSPGDFRGAILSENHRRIATVPGIGPKTAQKIVLELRDKVMALGAVTTGPVTGPHQAAVPQWRDQVSDGLQGLGWSAKDAEAACERVAGLAESETNIATLMRAALQTLAKK
jgi:Holliday junction DNA helicase RuvA